MAVGRIIRSQLRLSLDNGVHPTSRNVILKVKTFNNVKTDATPDQLYAVAHALADLQTLPLYGIERTDASEITQF